MTIRHASIAESLEALCPKVRKRLAWLGTAEVLIALSAFVLLSLPLDWLFELPLAARVVLLAAAGALVAIVAVRARRRLLQRFEEADMAAAVEGADPSLDGHLANVLDLPAEAQSLGAAAGAQAGLFDRVLEQKLLERALEESSERAARASIVGALSPVPLVERAGLAAIGIAIVLACAMGVSPIFGLWFRRDVLLSSEAWPRKTHFVLDRKEPVWHHARKDPLEIGAWVTGEIPRQVTLSLAGEGSRRDVILVPGAFGKVATASTEAADSESDAPAEVEGRRLLHTIPSVTESLELDLEGGDNRSDTVKVIVHDRPRILVTRLQLKFPAYLGLETKTLENPGGDVAVPAGTEIAVEAVADQELSAGWIRFGAGEKKPAAVAEKTARGSFVPAENGFLDIGITEGVWGLESEPPLRFAIVVLPDRPPSVALEIEGESRVITARGKVGYKVTAEDDHGFSDLSLKTWVRVAGDSRADEEIEPTVVRLTGSAEKIDGGVRTKVDGEVDLAPLNLATGSSITLQAWTADNDGVAGPKTASSQRETIVVVDPEELRKELDKVRVEAQASLEQLAAREEVVAQSVAQAAEGKRSPPKPPGPSPEPGERSSTAESTASDSQSSESTPSKSAASKSKSKKTASAKSAASKTKTASSKASPSSDESPDSDAEATASPQEDSSPPESAEASSKSAASKSAASKQARDRPAGSSKAAEKNEASLEEPTPPAAEQPEAPREETSPASQLAKEQEAIAKDAGAVSKKLREMTKTLKQNNLLEPAEERRFRDEVSKPLDEVAEERLPESASEIGALPESEQPAQQAAAAQRKAEKISDAMKNVAEKLAGTGNFREILQRLELIIELQQRTIGETEKRVPEGSAPGKPGDANGGKERSF